MTRPWFKPKTYGYGAVPVTWEGWLSTLLFVLVIQIPTFLLMIGPASERTGPQPWQLAGWLLSLTLISALFIGLAYWKTEGEWRWRWGQKD